MKLVSRFSSTFSGNLKSFQASFYKNQSRLIILGVVFFLLSLLDQLPYFNLVLNKTAILFITWALAVFLLKLSGKVSVVGALVCLGLCPLFLIAKNQLLAEETAIFAFGLLVIGAGQELIKFVKEEKRGQAT